MKRPTGRHAAPPAYQADIDAADAPTVPADLTAPHGAATVTTARHAARRTWWAVLTFRRPRAAAPPRRPDMMP